MFYPRMWSFIVTGTIGIIWAVFWLLIYRDPEHQRHGRYSRRGTQGDEG
jgi:hypothetical protein